MEVTVLYYDEEQLTKVQHAHLTAQQNNGRPLLTSEFREGKVIVAVIEGHVNVLNTMGDRWGSAKQMAAEAELK